MPGARPFIVALLAVLACAPAAQAATAEYPDLQTLPPRDLQFDVTTTDKGANRNVLRFTNTVWNAGQGDLRVGGDVDSSGTAPAIQTIENDDGTTQRYAIGSYVIHPEHQHFHYDNWGRYELWTKRAYDAWVAAGRPASMQPDMLGSKTTSCVLDEEFIRDLPATPYPRVWNDGGCDPTATGKINSGLSAGWGDTYDYYRYDQWIDLGASRLADGEYVLRSIADPLNKVYESAGKADATRESVAANEAMTVVRISGGQIVDLERPTGTVTVNDVDDTTSSTNVTMRVLGRDDVSGVDQVRVSNDGVTWRTYAYGGSGSSPMTITWDLADTRYGGSATQGTRTVYAQFHDRSGKWSASETDTIELKTGTTNPGGSNSLYRDAVLSASPISWWRLGEKTGATARDERGLNTGTYVGSPTLGGPSLLNSDVDTSARFAGASYVSVPSSSGMLLTSNVSLEAWIRPDALPAAGQFASVLTKPEAWSLQFNGPLLEFTIIQNGVRRRLQAPAGTIQARQAYHVVGTYNGTEQRLYVNGVQVGQAGLTGPASAGWSGVYIGSWDGHGEFFSGSIDEPAVYGSTLTGLQAKQHYDAGVSTAVGVSTPTGLSATAASSSRVDLRWTDTSTNETGFVVQRSTSSSFTTPTELRAGANATTLADTSASPSTTYFYRAKSVTATDDSGWSGTATATTPAAAPTAPAAPTALAATPASSTAITLSWTDASANETGFVLERSTTSTFTAPTAISLAANATSYSDAGRSASTTYWYRLRAVNGAGTSAWTAAASATTPAPTATAPAAPTGLAATAAAPTRVDLRWTDASANETGFVVERSTSSTFTSPTAFSVGANATTYSDTTAAASTAYWYRVKAVNGTLSSAWAPAASATTPAAPATDYAGAVTADGPVSHWRLGEASGTVAADARAANPGAYRNGVTLGAASLIAGTNTAALFDGGNDFLEVPDAASLDLTSAFTLETWIRPTRLPAAGGWASVLTKAESFSLQFNGPQLEFTLMQSGARRRLLAPAGAVAAGRTSHVVATYDGATQRLYIDGALVASRAQTGPATVTTWPVAIGSWSGLGEYLQGTVDEVAIYAKTLSAARVTAHFTAGRPAVATAARRRRAIARAARAATPRVSVLGPAQRLTAGLRGPGKALRKRLRSCATREVPAAARGARRIAAATRLRPLATRKLVARMKTDARRACTAARRAR